MRCTYRRRGFTGLIVSALLLCSVTHWRAARISTPRPQFSRQRRDIIQEKWSGPIWSLLILPRPRNFTVACSAGPFRAFAWAKLNYAVVMLDGRPIGGIVEKTIPAGQQRQPAWLTFLAANDIDAAKRLAVSHGAKVLAGRQELSDARPAMRAGGSRGRGVCAARLEQRRSAGLLCRRPASGSGVHFTARDAGAEAAFYQDVFGYDVFDMPSDGWLGTPDYVER